jgi:hypothetical protein
LNNKEKKFDVFLSHHRAADTLKRDNHKRVSQLNDYLQSHGIKTWFDGQQMDGNTRQTMAGAISASRIFMVFVTETIEVKSREGEGTVNCFYEFNDAMSTAPLMTSWSCCGEGYD